MKNLITQKIFKYFFVLSFIKSKLGFWIQEAGIIFILKVLCRLLCSVHGGFQNDFLLFSDTALYKYTQPELSVLQSYSVIALIDQFSFLHTAEYRGASVFFFKFLWNKVFKIVIKGKCT